MNTIQAQVLYGEARFMGFLKWFRPAKKYMRCGEVYRYRSFYDWSRRAQSMRRSWGGGNVATVMCLGRRWYLRCGDDKHINERTMNGMKRRGARTEYALDEWNMRWGFSDVPSCEIDERENSKDQSLVGGLRELPCAYKLVKLAATSAISRGSSKYCRAFADVSTGLLWQVNGYYCWIAADRIAHLQF